MWIYFRLMYFFCCVVTLCFAFFLCCFVFRLFCFRGSFRSQIFKLSGTLLDLSPLLSFLHIIASAFYNVIYCFTMFFSIFPFLNVRLRRGNS